MIDQLRFHDLTERVPVYQPGKHDGPGETPAIDLADDYVEVFDVSQVAKGLDLMDLSRDGLFKSLSLIPPYQHFWMEYKHPAKYGYYIGGLFFHYIAAENRAHSTLSSHPDFINPPGIVQSRVLNEHTQPFQSDPTDPSEQTHREVRDLFDLPDDYHDNRSFYDRHGYGFHLYCYSEDHTDVRQIGSGSIIVSTDGTPFCTQPFPVESTGPVQTIEGLRFELETDTMQSDDDFHPGDWPLIQDDFEGYFDQPRTLPDRYEPHREAIMNQFDTLGLFSRPVLQNERLMMYTDETRRSIDVFSRQSAFLDGLMDGLPKPSRDQQPLLSLGLCPVETLLPFFFGLTFLNRKSTNGDMKTETTNPVVPPETDRIEPDDALQKKRKKTHGTSGLSYRKVTNESLGEALNHNGNGSPKGKHSVRGHLAYYPNGLFNRGEPEMVYKPPHERGSSNHGEVQKHYDVSDDKH